LLADAENRQLALCRLILLADVRNFLGGCQVARALAMEGSLKDYTVVLLLDDLEVSSTKETLSKGGDRGSQSHW